MPTGRPDYTLATDIVAQSLANLSVDIAVQSIGNLDIDIAAMTLANLDVDIEAQTLGNLNIDIAAMTLANLDVDIEAQTIGNIQIDIAAQAVDRMYILPQAPTGATTIVKSGLAQGSTVVLHTVTAGKTFYATFANLTASSVEVVATVSLAVRNAGNVVQYYLARTKIRAKTWDAGVDWAYTGGAVGVPVSINPALAIPAGWDIVVISTHALCAGAASISGWEA